MVEIHAYHGWGFDGSFWDHLKSEIPKEILFKAAQRGYFGGEFEPEFSELSSTRIIFAHSFGLHWCPSTKMKEADVLVIFNGFEEFLPDEFFERRKELKVLKRMHTQFLKAPKLVLNAFFKNCFFPQEVTIEVPNWLNRSLLAKDLLALKKSKFDKHPPNLEVVSLAGLNDKIAPIVRTEMMNQHLQIKKTKVFNEDGHALAIVNSSGCWSYLNEVLPIFATYANNNEFK